jgi:hypothetical protein
MTKPIDHTQLHRTAKYFMDDGRAQTHEEALSLLQGFGLSINIASREAATANGQIALLSLVNAARRTFLGGVEVVGVPAATLLVPLASALTLSEAVVELGGQVVDIANPAWPSAIIGDVSSNVTSMPSWRLSWSGWRGGVVPAREGPVPTEGDAIALTPATAAAACIAEAFAYHAGDHPMAGRRESGLSLWTPGRDWRVPDPTEPTLAYLPSRLWLIGMGNLGQAFAWLLACLPYRDRTEVRLVLQDFDDLAESNDSTSLLASMSVVGQKKARLVSGWLEARGFTTVIDEHRFGEWTRRGPDDPGAAFCGVDNALARAALEKAGFELIVEAGLGGGPQGFRSFALHTFPSDRKADAIWSNAGATSTAQVDNNPAYAALRDSGMDACGLAQLSSRTVGVPFVGLTAAALAVAEFVRRLHGGGGLALVSGSMLALEDVASIPMNPAIYAHGHVAASGT